MEKYRHNTATNTVNGDIPLNLIFSILEIKKKNRLVKYFFHINILTRIDIVII